MFRRLQAKVTPMPPVTASCSSSITQPLLPLCGHNERRDARLVFGRLVRYRVPGMCFSSLARGLCRGVIRLLPANLGAAHAFRMLEVSFSCWWVGLNVCTLWQLCHCLECQARNSTPSTVRWRTVSMPYPRDCPLRSALTVSAVCGSHSTPG